MEWVYLERPDFWASLKKAFEDSVGTTKKAAEACGLPYHTYRRIGRQNDGKVSMWIPKESFDIILSSIGENYGDLGGNAKIYSDDEKKRMSLGKTVASVKEKYGPDFYREKARAQWAGDKRIDDVLQIGDERIDRISSDLSRVFGLDSGAIRSSFHAQKNNALDIGSFCSSEEAELLEYLGDGEKTYKDILAHFDKDITELNRLVYSLDDKGAIAVRLPLRRPKIFEGREVYDGYSESIVISVRKGSIERKMNALYREQLERIKQLRADVDGGYFARGKDGKYVTSKEAIEAEYEGVVWIRSEEIGTELALSEHAFEKAILVLEKPKYSSIV